MLTIFQAVVLGALQGVTEFLPISSSGHLVVVQHLFGWGADSSMILAFDVALHVGTLFAVLVIFRKEIVDMLTGRAWRLMGLLTVATIPAVIIGFSFKHAIEEMFTSVTLVGFTWLVTGTFLWCTKYVKNSDAPTFQSHDQVAEISWLHALLIGCAQAVAITPGISRSGSTISSGIFLKLNKTVAARFAFLMAIPAIGGSAILDAKELAAFPKEAMPQLFIGTAVSFIVGYISIRWLLSVIQHGRFWLFGIYCFIAGIVTLAFLR